MNLANEIEAGIVLARQLDRFFAFPDAEVFAGHVLLIPGARVTSEPGIQKQPQCLALDSRSRQKGLAATRLSA
jgi:hypothetical protein